MGAGAVVTNEAPPYAIVAVVPAKVLKFRFISDQIKKLLEIAWWNWTPEKFSIENRDSNTGTSGG